MNCKVSVVIEAYNEEQNDLGEHPEVIESLLRQDFPLDKVELVLVGGQAQLAEWKKAPSWNRFGNVRIVAMEKSHTHYWEQKNFGAQAAEGEIVAYVDSDVIAEPTWLSAIVRSIDNGADVSVGPSLYRASGHDSHSALMLALASISWGFVLSGRSKPGLPIAASLLAHNFGIRREVALQNPFLAEQASFYSSILFFNLTQKGLKVAYAPEQRAAHGIEFWWWVRRRHFRTGWETYDGRLTHPAWPRIRLLEKVKWIEPIILRGGMILRDSRHWFRFRRVTGVSATRAWLMLPLVVGASIVARTGEAIGMYSRLLSPNTMPKQARF